MNMRGAILLFIAAATAGSVFPQYRQTVNEPVEPFKLSSGSTFSASTGNEKTTAPDGRSKAKLSSISVAIGEAQEIIRREYFGGRYLSHRTLTDAALNGALHSLDPHSSFYGPDEWREMMDEQRSGYTGIGASIAGYETNGVTDTYILSVFDRSPAAIARLGFGDKIVAISGENMSDRDPGYVRDKIRGPNGSAVRVTVERAATLRQETIELRRGLVAQPSIPDWYILRPEIGYLDLSGGFNYTTHEEFSAALKDLKRQGMTSLVLDLRGNGGGILEQAVKVAETFLPAGTLIVTQKGRSRLDDRTWWSSNRAPEKMPLVLLVDENTASASEIVAGALQDNDRAMIVGEKTFGKGLVQTVLPLVGKTGLTLTTGRYLTPSGRSIQRDYAGIGRYEYYNHAGSSIAAGAAAYVETRTVTNRRVFGGDGINPDEVVKSDTASDQNALFVDPIFFFVRAMVADSSVASASTPPRKRVRRIPVFEFAVDAEMVAKFRSFLSSRSYWLHLVKKVDSNLPFIHQRLRHTLATATYGGTSAHQIIIENDPQVAKAVAILPRSAQLAHLAEKARPRK
jgi:carboxyl-terminal processing protease